MKDLVERQAVKDMLFYYWDEYCSAVIGDLENIPSADPEIIRCKDCKYYCNVLYSGTQSECGKCCRTFVEDVKPDDFCSRAERRTNA